MIKCEDCGKYIWFFQGSTRILLNVDSRNEIHKEWHLHCNGANDFWENNTK
jgi:hypothetical protein